MDHLPRDREAPPVWLWSSATGADPADVDFVRSCCLRGFDRWPRRLIVDAIS
ncbi:hypothetical protein P1P68_08965 [Streptomyces scabiei]|uniref:hypothetical protein n=1 Tax=Streptomyces scabiei TaxID=1930 RepID=UPI00298F461A|nr:hypothetical protein [Streptomyces scabiei]MDW8804913.1 hypothetical protein [Streptomyces scabiei]